MSEPMYHPWNLEGYEYDSGRAAGEKAGFADGIRKSLKAVVRDLDRVWEEEDEHERLVAIETLRKTYKEMLTEMEKSDEKRT